MKNSRLFIIANPTHLINAKNYIHTHEDGINHLILTITYFKGFEKFIDSVKEENRFKLLGIFFIDQNKKGFSLYLDILRKMIKVKSLRLDGFNFDEILFTNYNSWLQNYLVWKSGATKKILISDGTAIFDIVKFRKKNKKIPFKGNKIFIDHILKLKPIENLHFFCQVQLKTAEGDSLELFKFEASKTNQIDEKKIYFVGSPLVELSYLDSNMNLKYFKSLRDKFKDYEIYYFAHRRESEENLSTYNSFDKIINDATPFEERLLKEKKLPGLIISYLSSVLINLPEAYPKIEFYYLPIETNHITSNNFINKYIELKNNFNKIESKNFNELKISKNN